MPTVQPTKKERIDVCAMAHETLAARHLFLLTDEQWAEFQAALDRPAKDIPELRKLMTEQGVLG